MDMRQFKSEEEALLANKAQRIIDNNRNLSHKALKQKLSLKSIPAELVETLLAIDEVAELDHALMIVEKKYDGIKGASEYQRKHKMTQFLLRKGFTSDTSKLAIDKFLKANEVL